MHDTPTLSDAQWMEQVRQAHALRAAFYWEIFQSLRDAFGEDVALEHIRKAAYAIGLRKSLYFKERIEGEITPQNFAEAFGSMHPVALKLFEITTGTAACDRGEYETCAHLNRCALVDAWRTLDISDEDMAKLCEAARAIDYGTLAGLGLEGEFSELISEGGCMCHLQVRKPK